MTPAEGERLYAFYDALGREMHLAEKGVVLYDKSAVVPKVGPPRGVPPALWAELRRLNSKPQPLPVRLPNCSYDSTGIKSFQDWKPFGRRHPNNIPCEMASHSLAALDSNGMKALVYVQYSNPRVSSGRTVEFRYENGGWKAVRTALVFWST